MPVVALKFANLQAGGPMLAIRMMPASSRVKPKGRAFQDGLPLAALIDTGASVTVLKKGLADFLGLKPTGDALVHTASATHVHCAEFAVSLILPHGVKVRTKVLELPVGAPGIDCLIGRDVLAKLVMTYVGPENEIILSL